ncbi:glycosyltransferase [Mesonia sediminis]|uniref:Glycosyltransferase n=1 Tax=Mesonia sediminis TaxID=1703946 RepID=A0ABW5SGR7_9FLAO
MKILQIIDSLATGGAEKLLLDSLSLYREAGIEMDVLVLKDEDYPFMQQLEAMDSCKIYKLGSGSVYQPNHIFKIAKIIGQYDIAHVHLFPAQYWAVLAKQWSGASTKLIFTEHSTSNRRIRNRFSKPIEQYIYSKFDSIAVIADEVESALLKHISLSSDKVFKINNGVDILKYKKAEVQSRDQLNLSQKDFLVIQVSSFKYPKDQATVIKALSILPETVKLILVGDGPQRENCEALATRLGLSNRVCFLGNRNDVPALLKTADIVVLSSHYEGMSLSSIEGMASGRPFIASDVPGLAPIVKDAGLLFPVGDAETLAELILKLKHEPIFNQKIVEACQKRAAQYDIQIMVNQYIQLYEQILA